MPSRRAALRSLGAAVLGAAAGCSAPELGPGANARPPESVGSDWAPPTGTWPTPLGGPRNRHAVATTVGAERSVDRRFDRLHPDTDAPRSVVAATPTTVSLLVESTRRGVAELAVRGTDDWATRLTHQFPDAYVNEGGVAGGRLYAASDGSVRAVDVDGASGPGWAVDYYGRLAESVDTDYLPNDRDDLEFVPVPTPATLYGLSAYGLHGLDPADGDERWRVPLPDAPAVVLGGLAVGDDAVWATAEETLYRLDTDGLAATRLPETGFVRPPVVVGDRTVLTPSGQTSARPPFAVAAYDPSTLSTAVDDPPATDPAWTFRGHPDVDGATSFVTAPAVADGRVVVGEVVSPDGLPVQRAAVHAVDAVTGDHHWSHDLAVEASTTSVVPALSSPVVAGDSLLVGLAPRWSYEHRPDREVGEVVALSAADGTERWRVDVGIQPARLAVAGDTCYVADPAGRLVAVR